ncbi:MAG: TPM domain-containing protein [Bacteroidetes bacterium]|nr:TPM domain-containing protein [Bacteroidota bacterium]
MARFLRSTFLKSVFIFFVSTSFAQKAVPELWNQRVHDDAHVLQQATVDQLEKTLKAYEDSTSNQIAILLVQSLDGEVLEDYSLRVAEKWKLGQKEKDNGVLLLIAVDDHKMRIEVGQGLEGVLTDAQSNRIIRNEIAPEFRRGDYDAGINNGVSAIVKAIGGEYTADDLSPSSELSFTEKLFFGLFIFGILGLFTLFAISVQGCTGWGLYAFLIPFYATFPWIILGSSALVLLALYVIAIPILRLIFARSEWGKKMIKKMNSGSGGRTGSGWSGGWSSGSSSGWSSGGSSFSGGGGSFGGGGSSGGW